MQISDVFAALRRRWYASVLIVIVAVAAALLVSRSVAGVPTGSATVQVLVDSPVSSLVNLQADPASLEARASVLAQAMASNAVVASIAKTAGVPAHEVTAQGPYSGAGQALNVPTPSEARGTQIASATAPYRLAFVAQQQIPIVTVSVTGPTPATAGKLADAVLPGTNAWLNTLASAERVKTGRLVHLRQLGDAQTGPVTSSSAKLLGGAGAVAVLIFGFLAVVLTDRGGARGQRRELPDANLPFGVEPILGGGTSAHHVAGLLDVLEPDVPVHLDNSGARSRSAHQGPVQSAQPARGPLNLELAIARRRASRKG
jgi:capsular polysaccharide biosynthesis protein